MKVVCNCKSGWSVQAYSIHANLEARARSSPGRAAASCGCGAQSILSACRREGRELYCMPFRRHSINSNSYRWYKHNTHPFTCTLRLRLLDVLGCWDSAKNICSSSADDYEKLASCGKGEPPDKPSRVRCSFFRCLSVHHPSSGTT